MAVQTKIQLRRDTAANWVTAQTNAGATPILAAGEIGFETNTGKFKIGDGTTLWGSLKYVSDGSYISGDATGIANLTTTGNVIVGGNLTVNGTTTAINSTTLNVDDKNIVLGNNASSSNTTADGGGITLEATTGGDKTLNWVNATGAWTSSEDFNLLTGKVYEINGTTVLTSTQVLGYSVATANTASAIVARDASGNFAAGTITASLTGVASLASNLTGGTANKGEIVYMSGVNTSSKLTATTTNNQVLAYNTATNAPYWAAITGTGSVVLATSPTLVTPALGVATGTSINVTGQLISTQATGTAPLSVASTTVVANLNADLVDGFNTATAATANTVAVRDANASLTANVFIGASANVTGQLISTVSTGTAPFAVSSTTRVTNLNAATAGVADSATIAGQANNLTGTTPNLIPYQSASNTTTFLAAPAGNNYVLSANTTGAPFWAAASATGVTSVSAGTGMSFTTITATGSVAIDTSVVPRFAATGTFTALQTFQNAANSAAGLVVKNHSTQQVNPFEVQYANGTSMVSVSNTGTLTAVTIDGGTA